jgi:hypothetical protein
MMQRKRQSPFLIHQQAQASFSLNCTKANYTWISVQPPCGVIGLKKATDQVLAWKSGRKVPLLPWGPSCSLQPIYFAGDLVRYRSLLQIMMAV